MEVTKMNANQSNQDNPQDAVKQHVDERLDYAFGPGTAQTAQGHTDEVVGYSEAQFGRAAGDQALVNEGLAREERGAAERAVGQVEIDLANLQIELDKEATAFVAQLASQTAEYAAATGDSKVTAGANLLATKADLQATQARIRAALNEAQEKSNAQVASLQQQAAQATGEAKAREEDKIAQTRNDYNHLMGQLKQSLQKTENALTA